MARGVQRTGCCSKVPMTPDTTRWVNVERRRGISFNIPHEVADKVAGRIKACRRLHQRAGITVELRRALTYEA